MSTLGTGLFGCVWKSGGKMLGIKVQGEQKFCKENQKAKAAKKKKREVPRAS